MINIVAFSKDRACQLDSLLRSIAENIEIEHTVSVLYSYSTDAYKQGYDLVMDRFKDVSFTKETNFYNDTLALTLKEDYPCFLWLVDDCIIKNKFRKDKFFDRFISDPTIGIYNLRLTPSTLRMTDFPEDNVRPLPSFGPDNTWEWRKAVDEDWSYPMTMDGHMYKTAQMSPYLHSITFGPPPSMDTTMWRRPLNTNIMICNDQQKILGVVPNRVQTGSPNRHGDVTTEELNNRWLSGQQLSLSYLYSFDETCGKYHYIPLEFENR